MATIDYEKIQASFDTYRKELENEAAARKEAAEKRAEAARQEFREDGIVYSIIASRNGYTSIVSSSLDTERPVISTRENLVKDIKVKPATATLVAVGCVLKNLDANSKKNIVFSVQSTEVRRIAGIIRRAKNGEPVQLTEKEVEYIDNNDSYDKKTYLTAANGLAKIIKKTIETGFKISVVSNNDLYSFALSYQPEDAEKFNGKEVIFTNGSATIGRQTIRVANYNLNGMHKLVIYKGKLGVKREVTSERNPATYVAQQLLSFATFAVNNAANKVAENTDNDNDLDIAI